MNRKTNGSGGDFKLENGSRIAVIGGGPAGSFFTYFSLDLAKRTGLDISIDIYESKDFMKCGPAGCNHCGGIVSETLVQILSTEGITIPDKVVRRGIDSYVLHMDVGSIKIDTPLHESRIAAMYRGAGPRGSEENNDWESFDNFLKELCISNGANLIEQKVINIEKVDDYPHVVLKNDEKVKYDLVVGAVGIQGKSHKLFEGMDINFKPPEATKTFICEFDLGEETVLEYFGKSMHVFLLNIPRLKFGALIPKGNYVSMVLLGEEIDKQLVADFISHEDVISCFPDGIDLIKAYPCQCFPQINIKGAEHPYSDRIVLLGDCAVSKLYKNGIGAAYVTSKSAATTAILHGISKETFAKYYQPTCDKIEKDNGIGKFVFFVTHFIQKMKIFKKGVFHMVRGELTKKGERRIMSNVLWDTFTGSSSYTSILLRTFKPSFWLVFIMKIIRSFLPMKKTKLINNSLSTSDQLGITYQDGDLIIKQGDKGDTMFVIQEGKVQVLQDRDGVEIPVAILEKNEFFGEMAIFEQDVRSSSIRSVGTSRILTVDKKTLMQTIQDNPSLAFRLLRKQSNRIRNMDSMLTKIAKSDRRDWTKRPVNKP